MDILGPPALPFTPIWSAANLNILEFTVIVGHAAHYELPLAVPVEREKRR